MKLKQISIFLENRPGHLEKACRKLADMRLNVEAMSLADTEQYGILRFLIKDWEKAVEICKKEGLAVKVTDVLAVAVPDRPGGLAELLGALSKINVNIEYMYGFSSHPVGQAVIVLRLDQPDEALALLKKEGVRVLSIDEVFTSKTV